MKLVSLAACLVTVSALVPSALGQFAPVDGHPDWWDHFDSRLLPDGTPRWPEGMAARATRADALAALRREVPGVRVDFAPPLDTAQFIRSTESFLTPPRQGPASFLVREFVRDHASLLEIDPLEIETAKITSDFVTEHLGVRHMIFRQQVRGVDLWTCELRANITARGEIVNVGSTMIPRPPEDFTPSAVTITDCDAIVLAARDVGVELKTPPSPEAASAGGEQLRLWKPSPELRADEPVATRLVYFPRTRSDIRSAWWVVMPLKGVGHTYDMLVDATTGDILWRMDRLVYDTTQPITFRVYTSDSPSPLSPGRPAPDGFQPPVIPRELVTVTPDQMRPNSPDGWINDGNMETLGNNVDSHTDSDGTPNQPDLPRPNGGATRVFDFPLDLTQAPPSYKHAVVTQLFYLSNFYHDRVYALGFNEAAGNFQTVNFSGQGVAGDAMQADAQDSSGTNNANFNGNGSDGPGTGVNGRIQMYIFTGPTPDRDGSLDADVVFHELTHGTSIRLHRLNGLTATQSRSMGEGWSDFFGLCINSQASDDVNGTYPSGGYLAYQILATTFANNYYSGIRRYPYCTDMGKNPETFRHINDPITSSAPLSALFATGGPFGNTPNEVHNAGEVWCSMLWEVRARLVQRLGYAVGNDLAMRAVIDGMKLAPLNPNFVQERDAILQGAQSAGDVNLISDLWQAFAKRGIGNGAASGPSSGTTGIVESFDVPFNVFFTYASGQPQRLDPGSPTSFPITITPQLVTITPGSEKLFVSVNGGAFTPITLAHATGDAYTATLPASNCFDRLRFYVSADTDHGTFISPPGAPTTSFGASVYTGNQPVFEDDFEAARGWTASWSSNRGQVVHGQWFRTAPRGSFRGTTPVAPGEDHTSGTGVNAYITQQTSPNNVSAPGADDVDEGTVYLTSPTLNFAGAHDMLISFWRWFYNGSTSGPSNAVMQVDVSNDNGTTWTTVKTIGGDGAPSGAWVYDEALASSVTPPIAMTATMKVRFSAHDPSRIPEEPDIVVESGVDDVSIRSVICAAHCVADVDDGSGTGHPDGGVTIDDLLYYIAQFTAGNIAADVDDGSGTGHPDGGVTIDDLVYFLFRFDAGC